MFFIDGKEEISLKILVLGNGFDLDHNLPTSYLDFLNFCNFVLDMDNPDSITIEKLKPSQLKYVELLRSSEPVKNTFSILLMNNHLLNYFNTKLQAQGENWIDFERELKGIVSEFKVIEFELSQSNQYNYTISSKHKAHQILKDLGLSGMDSDLWDEIRLAALHKDLCYSLNNFSAALDYYIYTFINSTPIEGVSPDIIDFAATNILSFNYSNTYERVYGGLRWRETIDHVHGEANGTISKEPGIILGITSNEKNLQNYYVEFEKYFQRITKKTGNEHKKWLQQRQGIQENIEVMFFGHSLDATDSDIIKDLIFCESSKVKIYYYDEKAHQQIVANLVEIIGKENLIEYVSGAEPKIEFIKQRIHRVENTAGVEITRDIRKLYNLYMLNEVDIEKLLRKITEKIETEDLSYFYSQEKIISIFEALKYHQIDILKTSVAFSICEKLNFETRKNGKVHIFHEEEWCGHTPWGDEMPCNVETSKLIKAVNKSNKKRFQEEELSNPYATLLTLETVEEMKKEIVNIFTKGSVDDKYWEQLNKLIGLMYGNKLFDEALTSINKDIFSLSEKSKFMHFYNCYEEHCFNISYAQQMANNYHDDE